MTKKIISLILSISLSASSLTVFAEQDDINITLTNELNTDFEYDISNGLTAVDNINVSEMPLDMPVSVNDENAVIDLENDNTEIQAYTASGDSVDVNEKSTLTAEDINGMDDDEFEEDDEHKQLSTAKTSGEIRVKETASYSSRSVTTALDTQNRLNNINFKDSFSLQNQTGRTSYVGDNIGEEYVDSLTGNLIVTETDLTLPGVDGFDLKLERYYSLAEAEIFSKSAGTEIDPVTFIMPEGSYVVTESVYNTETYETSTYQYPYASQNEAELRVEEIKSRDTCNGLYIYNAHYDLCSEGDEVLVNYYYTSDITSSSYSTIRSNLGAGWSWSFPSVQPVKSNYNDYNEFEMPEAIYYHDGKGNVTEVEYDRLNGCRFTNHVGSDITFDIWGDYDTNICNSARIDYVVEDENQTEYYFGPHGEIRTIMDVHGNKITFDYTDKSFYGAEKWPIINQITDSVGRKVNFKYYTDGDTEEIVVTVTSPVATEQNITLTYTKEMIGFSKGGETISSEPILTEVTNNLGETTYYSPAPVAGKRSYVQPIEFTFADKSLTSTYLLNTSGTQNDYVYLLGNIIRPHSNTYYEYSITERNLGHSGVSEAYVVKEKGDYELTVYNDTVEETYYKNRIKYKYSYDYTGYPYYHSVSAIPEGDYVCRFKETRGQSSTIQKFYKQDDAVLLKYTSTTYQNAVGNYLNISSEVLSYLYKQPIRTEIEYSNGSHSYTSYVQTQYETNTSSRAFGKPELITEEVDYDTVIGADREKHATQYEYNFDTGNIEKKIWYKDDSTRCVERYYYDDNRLSKIKKADGTIIIYTYEENSKGKVTKKTTTITNGDETCVTVENYSSATGFAFPDSITKTVTANGTTTTDTISYTYNMIFGAVTSETSSNGTTYYEYDKLARPVRIVYPKYTAYSDYDEKDIDILPVENIGYYTIARTDYPGCGDETEKLITQAVQTTTRYYSVSDISSSCPTDTELENCGIYYIGDEINYYMGTGELIENRTLERLSNESGYEYIKTTYVYDTVNNIVTTIDNSGNTTKVYYDDLGRKIKTVDMFDNAYVMEYNGDSENDGFTALSYFVPQSDTAAKENVIEYTYDRLQRVTSEKAYESYPDTFTETKYSYDITGNVVGITDGNGNLNNDGYTTSYTYDNLNRVLTSTNANNEVLSNTYDVFDNIKKQVLSDGKGNTSTLYQRTYDGEGKIISDTDNSGNSNTYSYNSLGQLEQAVNKNGKISNYEYNETGTNDRIYNVSIGTGIVDEQHFNYTPFGASTALRVNAIYNEDTDGYTGSFAELRNISYSPAGKILADKSKYYTATGAENVYFYPEAQYSYDIYGNLTNNTFALIDDVNEKKYAVTTSYTYDKNRLSTVSIPGGSNAQYSFYDDGKLKSVTYPALSDGSVIKSEYVYDGLSRLKTLTNKKDSTVLSSYSYTYDDNGNILTTTEVAGDETDTTTYTYDKLNRITSVSGTKNADSYYEYDYRGNRKVNFEQTDFLSEENAAYSYDLLENMIYSQTGDDLAIMLYGTNGYRYVKRDNSEMPEYYVYDQSGRLQAEATLIYATVNGTRQIIMYPEYQYVWGADRVLAQFDVLNSEIYYYLYNGHGDVIQIVDESGNIVNSYDYDVWGNFLEKEETVHNPFTYFGQTYDEATGLYYLRARYYDPQTGRFTQQDTAEDGYNWYVYGNNNPVLYVDETGEEGVAVTMLWDAFFGGGEYKDYSTNQEIMRTFYSSPNLNKIVNSNLSSFKSTGLSSKTYTGTVSFYGNDKNLNDLDLHLAVGLADYSMTFTKETVSKKFLWKTWEETIYSVKITISDNYNFDNYREGEHFSDFLNNWGYNRQQKGTITPYYWSITFSKRGI